MSLRRAANAAAGSCGLQMTLDARCRSIAQLLSCWAARPHVTSQADSAPLRDIVKSWVTKHADMACQCGGRKQQRGGQHTPSLSAYQAACSVLVGNLARQQILETVVMAGRLRQIP